MAERKGTIPRNAEEVRDTYHAVANDLLRTHPEASSVIQVDNRGNAEQVFTVGNAEGLTPSEAVDLMQNKGIRIRK